MVKIMKKELNNDVLINRKILGWEWYKDVNTYKLFTHLIYKANYEDSMYRGIKVLRGQIYTGLDLLKFETGLTMQQTRTAIKKLISTNDITSKTTNKYRLITVLNYNKYQLTNKQLNKQSNKQNKQSVTSTLTASKEYKEHKEYKEEDIKDTIVQIPYKEIVDILNKKIDTNFSFNTTNTRTKIKARWNERLKDKKSPDVIFKEFILCINNAYEYWKKKNDFNFMRPKTLFNGDMENRVNGTAYGWEIRSVGKNLLPTDIESDWLDSYIKSVKES